MLQEEKHFRQACVKYGVMSLYRQGQYDRTVVVAKKALQVGEQKVDPDHSNVDTSLHNPAALYQTQGQYAQAEPLYKRSLAIPRENVSTNDLIPLTYKNQSYG